VYRLFAVLATVLILSLEICSAQSLTSDPQALALVAKSVAAMTGGQPLSGVTLNATAIWTSGSDNFSGPANLQATGTTDSRVDLTLKGFTRTEIRTTSGGMPSGSWIGASAKAQPFAQHNCWTDAAWFFPALSSLTQNANPAFFFSYIGQEQRGALTVQHIRVFQHFPLNQNLPSPVDRLSVSDVYLDPVSFLPLAVAFKVHPDRDANVDIPMEIRFANYQVVSGVQVPFHVQRLLNGSLALDLTVTNAVMNSTLSTTSSQVQ